MKGLINFWNDEKGYGFITAEGRTRQYFFHYSNFQEGHRPIIRYRVTFEVGPGKGGRGEQAINVRLVDMTPVIESPAVIAGFEEALNAGGVE